MNTHNMDEKRERRQMLLIYVAIGVVAAVITGWFLYQNRMEFWKTQARSAFRVALGEELQKQKVEIPFHMQGDINLSIVDANDQKKEPITVSMVSEYGEKDFIIPYEKHIHNIERPSDWRVIRSIVLEERPLIADSLDLVWKNLLGRIEYPGKTVVRVSVLDWWEHETCSYSGDSLYLSKSDSLVAHYLGYRCEVGVTGYLYGPWWVILSWKDMLLLGALIVGCILLFFVQDYVDRIYRRLFVKKIPVVIEKEIPVIACHESQSHIYRLEDGLRFDADLNMLKKGDACVKLAPLSAKLLQGFLDMEDCRLSNDEILCLLWPNGNGTSDKLYTNVRRLRGYLSQISNYTIENENFSYQLKKSHFIEENSV